MISAKQLAEILGISPSAVSIALNGRPGISEETRKKILETAEQMGYVHKKRAGSQNTNIYLFVSSSFNGSSTTDPNLFVDQVIQGISYEAQQLSYSLNITYVELASLTAEKIQAMIDRDCSGIILLATAGESVDADIMRSLKIPFVTLDKPAEMYGLDSITIANAQGIQLAVEYLLSLGHTRLAYFGGGTGFSNFSERYLGFVNTVAVHPELAGSEKNILQVHRSRSVAFDYSESINTFLDGKAASGEPLPTGFVCATDWMAISCIQTLTARGYRIPEDISVIGFDNISLSEIVTPKLTTINVPKERMGALAVDRLHDIITGTAKERVKISVLTNLVIRESTGPAKQ